MAYIVGVTETASATTGATYTSTNGPHVSGNVLLHHVKNDTGSTPISFYNVSVTVSNDGSGKALFSYGATSDYWTNGDQITLSGTSAPGGFSFETVRYFVRDLDTTANTFKLESSVGGGALAYSSAGTSVVANLMTTGTNHPLGSGWRMLGIQARASTTHRSAIAYKVAASASETNPTFYGTSDDWASDCTVIRDADSSPFGSEVSGTDWVLATQTSGTTHAGSTVTTASNGCLILHLMAYKGTGNVTGALRHKTNFTRCASKKVEAQIVSAIGYELQESSGATTARTVYKGGGAGAGNYWTIAVRNATNGALQPDLRPDVTELASYAGPALGTADPVTWQSPDNFTTTAINGLSISTIAATAGTTASAIGNTDESWGSWATLLSTEVTSGLWVGATHTITSENMTGKVFAVTRTSTVLPSDTLAGAEGTLVGFSDGTKWAVFQVSSATTGWALGTAFIACGVSTPYAASETPSTLNWSAITRIAYLWHRKGSSTGSAGIWIKNGVLFGQTSIVGGGSARPATFADYAKALPSWGGWQWSKLQGQSQTLAHSSVQIGNGSIKTVFKGAASSFEFPPEYRKATDGQIFWNATAGAVGLRVKASANDTINLSAGVAATDTAQLLTLDSASNTGATYSFVGESFVGWTPAIEADVPITGATFSQCGEIAFLGVDVTDCTITETTSTDAAAAWSVSGAVVTRTTIDLTGTSAAYHIELGSSVTSITLDDVTFTGTPGTDKIHVKATTGTVTITIDGTTSLAAGDVTSDGATVSIVAPTLERGLEFTGLVAGSKVKVFSTGTDTERFSTASSGTTETWDDATSGSITVDYVILKAGYEPIRVTGVTVTGAVGTGVQTVPVAQVVARWYQAASGLTINTNAFANASTKKFGLTAASTLQNFASYLLEQWIALGDTGEAYANKAWPLQANGPNSFTWLDGWTADLATYPNTISNLSRDGMRYLDASGNVTAMWAAILSVGVPSGARVRFQQVEGTTQSAAVTSGNMDELIQILSDPNGDGSYADGYDRRGYLVLKVQESGYDEATANAITLYGNLEDQLYVVGLAPTANGVATGSPGAVTATITDHGASPVTWHGAAYSITIQSDASGETIMRWLRYNFETGGTFQGTDAFNWHDLVQVNGDAFKTIRGAIYGDTGASIKGVRVITSGGDDHPYFTLYTADDGSTYAPVIPATASATILAGSRVQLYNVTTDTEIENVVEATTSYSYTITTEASVGDVLRLRVCKLGYEPEEVTGVWSASGLTFLVSQSSDPIYTAWGIDGSAVTEFTLDVTGNIEIDANDVDGATLKTRLGAWFNYALTTEDGIRSAFGAITALATNAIRINVDVVDLTIENVNATTALRFTDTDVRLYRSDGTTIIAATSYSIHNDYSGVPDVVETGVSGLTGSESAQLMGLPSATATAAAVIAAAEVAPIHADVRKVTGATISGSGTEADPWGP